MAKTSIISISWITFYPCNPLQDDKNFRLVQIERNCRRHFKVHLNEKKKKYHIGWKTLWEKEKLLVTSNFSFSHNVFHSYISSVRQNAALCGDWLTLSQTSPCFYVSAVQVFWKHWGKRRNCSSRAISPFPTLFSTCLDNFLPFSSILKLSSANSFSLEEESKICH